jgi:hypothetical protein
MMTEALVPLKRRFLQEPHGVISQKTPFFKQFISFSQHKLFYHVTIMVMTQLNAQNLIPPSEEEKK